jgi:hypothetical protein
MLFLEKGFGPRVQSSAPYEKTFTHFCQSPRATRLVAQKVGEAGILKGYLQTTQGRLDSSQAAQSDRPNSQQGQDDSHLADAQK